MEQEADGKVSLGENNGKMGRGRCGSEVCKETHGISAGARPLMIHNGIKEIKNHNNVNIHTKSM